jgi:hypothetical protein
MRFSLMTSIAAALLLNVGCAEEKGSPAAQVPDSSCRGCGVPDPAIQGQLPPAPAGTGEDPASTGYQSGSTVSLTLNGGAATLAELFFNSIPNNPTNVRVNIDLRRNSESVIVSYFDSGRKVEAAFGTVHPTNPNVSNSMYNGWVNQDGKSVWKGFFQDQYGAIVLIIDRMLSTGDGSPAKFVGGSIWFQNFNQYYPNNPLQGPLKMCWEISLGPYDCRSFLIGNYVNMISSALPTTRGPDKQVSYKKLGEFNGMARSEAGF